MADQAAPAFPEHLKAELREVTVDSFNYWKENSTEAQRAVGIEEMRKFSEDQEFLQQMMTEMQQLFDAQSPVDGRVNEA